MRKTFLFLAFAVLMQTTAVAQEKFKFGTVPQNLLEMSVYEQDTTAAAVVLYEDCDIRYEWSMSYNDFERVTNYVVRIKILKAQGTDLANGSVSIYSGKTSANSERMSGLTGFTYNLENGKIVKTQLDKQYINTEVVNENWKRTKFALSAVKAGSVIEYKYSVTSPHYYNSVDYTFQRNIPVKYSRFGIIIPQYFTFNKETRGYETAKTNVQAVNLSYNLGGGSILSCSGEETVSEMSNLPALKDENYVWNYNDFKSGIKLELQKVYVPGSIYKDYSQTWSNVATWLREADSFGRQFNNRFTLKNEAEAIKNSSDEVETKLRAALDLVRSKVKWNEKSRLLIDNATKALNDGSGSSAEINMILLNTLKNAGFSAIPVAMSTRSSGRLPFTYPSIDDLNYFVVRVDVDSKIYYMDATQNYCDLNVIPLECLVEKALVLQPETYTWQDLTQIGRNAETTNMQLAFNDAGFLAGKRLKTYYGECAYLFKRNFEKAKNEEKFIENTESNNNITLSDFTTEEKRNANYSYTEIYDFTTTNVQLGDNEIVMFLPMIFETMRSNPFKAETRKLPVEFNFPEDDKINVTIKIPSGYVVDELPQSSKITYGERNEIEFTYLLQTDGNTIQILYRNKLTDSIIPAARYTDLRDFMSKVYAKCNEMIVLKKVKE
ncbi:MAG: DUF3857 domain-containing protein [Paludibacter sp.]|jgi:hypothetical protein|nr:DUF3857 domain-containing protein [Paludibacter sp.]